MASSNKKFLDPDLERHFPNLNRNLYEVKSEQTPFSNALVVPPYNCIAFAAGDDTRWWQPDPTGQYYWPAGVKREYTLAAHVEMFESLGYQKCSERTPETNFEKVAVYCTRLGNPWTLPSTPTHAALQQNGIWKSKIGEWEDIEHLNLECLNGEDVTGKTEPYGEPIQILKRHI